LSLVEVKSQMNVTIDFMLQLPVSEKSMFQNYRLKIYEDLSAYKSRLRIFHQKMVTDQTINLVIGFPNFEPVSFRNRLFEFHFE